MSSILKALRRLEEERARKSQVAPEIAASLLRSGSRRRQSVAWIWPTVFALVTLMFAVLLWLWRPAARPNLINSPAPLAVTLSTPLPVGRGGEVIIEEVIDQRRPVLLPPVESPLPAKILPVKVNPPPEPKVENPSALNKPPAFPNPERQQPIVSAIAWQDDSSARMAVVDGLPVMTGEFVAAAKVVEIQRDRILFEEDGVRFIVRMQSP